MAEKKDSWPSSKKRQIKALGAIKDLKYKIMLKIPFKRNSKGVHSTII